MRVRMTHHRLLRIGDAPSHVSGWQAEASGALGGGVGVRNM
jgi:hypothetical protein